MNEISAIEMSIIHRFANLMGSQFGSPVMRFGELASSSEHSSHALAAAIDGLIQRGWLFRGGSIQNSSTDPCILLGEGLMIATRLARSRFEITSESA